MELDRIFEKMLDAIKESDAAKKTLIQSLAELMDEVKENEIIHLCVLAFVNKAAALEGKNDYQCGYVAAAADLCELIDIARGVKTDEELGEESDHAPEADAE